MKMSFSSECPYCGKVGREVLYTSTDIDGDYAVDCGHCDKKFLIHWFMVIDAEIFKCDEVSPPVRCSVTLEETLEESLDREEEDDEGVQA